MRQPVLLVALVLLAVYVALPAVHPRLAPGAGVGVLGRAVAAMGGRLDSAVLSAAEPVADQDAAERLAARLGWDREAPPAEQRRLTVEGGAVRPVLSVEWRLQGPAADRWAESYAVLAGALASEGLRVPVHVELSGRTARDGSPLALAGAALDGVAARGRQPWAEGQSASVAGWSPLLPPGPYPVNVQVAVRREGEEGRFWIGWPVVRSDY